ncbi:MAG: cupin domain-containing protein [Polyangiales bacterium]
MQAHEIDSGRPLSPEDLQREGILYRTLPLENTGYQAFLDELKDREGYITQDVIELRPDTPELEVLCAKFDVEHLHDEDEVRFLLEGEGIFDIRSRDDRWMRVKIERGDLIVVPAKRYHRFELTDTRTMKCVRLFQEQGGWIPHYR